MLRCQFLPHRVSGSGANQTAIRIQQQGHRRGLRNAGRSLSGDFASQNGIEFSSGHVKWLITDTRTILQLQQPEDPGGMGVAMQSSGI